ncbi:MAG TPA: LysR family transcriptional regulator, partial [Xanthobacteraceae bacterium]|nr:LysR family transcriptional regulator [Xanthobacteraceae bacterium]
MARAAAQLNLTQPAVSKAMSELEHMLGVRLLDRNRQGIEPTPHGRALLKRGLAIFDELRQGVSEIESLSDPTAGEVRVAASDPIAVGPLPVVIDQLSKSHPRMTIHVTQYAVASLHHRIPRYGPLRDRDVDLFVGQIVDAQSADLQTEKLFDDRIAVISGARSHWVRRRKIAL